MDNIEKKLEDILKLLKEIDRRVKNIESKIHYNT